MTKKEEKQLIPKKEDLPEVKKKKPLKTISLKKLPRLYKKRYSENKFKNKISKRLYIDKDRDFVSSFFKLEQSEKKTYLSIPKDTLFTKKDVSRLKILAKQIKKQKNRFKWIPFCASILVFISLIALIVLFKDPLLKKGIQSGLEAIFQAKCDIDYLHLGILDANFTLKGLAVADKDNTMTNLFQVGRITFDFDLKQLLRKRFVSDEIAVSDVMIGTPRDTDGYLPPKPKKQKQPSKFQLQLEAFVEEKKETLTNTLTDIFQQYNPETLLENFYQQLKSPELTKLAEAQLNEIIPRWQATPDEITASVTNAISQGQEAADFNWGAVKQEPLKLKEGVELISVALKSVDSTKNQLENTLSSFRKDANTVKSLAQEVQNAVSSDYNLVSSEINKITNFSIKDDGLDILSSSFSTVIANLFGKYYPMFQEVVALVKEYSAKKAELPIEVEEEKEELPRRYEGRYVEYSKDTIPSFLIKKINGSGSGEKFALNINITDISNDMEKWGKPAFIQGTAVHGGMSDTITGSLDLRKDRVADMLNLNYNGSGYNVNLALPEEEKVAGVPSATGTGSFVASLFANENGSFGLGGTVMLKPVTFTTEAFEPEFAFSLYNRALEKFSSVQAEVNVGISGSGGLDIDVDSDIDRQFVNVLTELANEELSLIKEQATVEVKETLDTATAGFTEKYGTFDEIQGRIEAQSARLDNFKAQLEQKRNDIQNQLKNAAEETVQKTTEAVKDKVDTTVENIKDSATNALKGLFSR
ncbi:MAG: TIGR03545 family protein [Spirochaetaceae bacterium]|nr:TIGR03545 family protein [Spirochaetaceae bacterium]